MLQRNQKALHQFGVTQHSKDYTGGGQLAPDNGSSAKERIQRG
jgi:hypothetical protein